MDVDLTLQIPCPVRDASGNAIWQTSGAPSKLPSRPPIRFRHIAWLLVGGILSGLVIGFIAALVAYAFTKSQFVTGMILGLSVYGSLIWGYQRSARERDWIGLRASFATVGRKPILLGALAGFAVIAVTTTLSFVLKAIGINIKDTPDPGILPHHWSQFPFAFLLIVVVAPICEELLFRGLLLDWLKQKLNVWTAALILSVIFSLLHSNPFSLGAVGYLAFFHRFLMGVTASALRVKYGSLLPSFTLHATINGIACIAAIVE
jgi:membrane protease YdiL (CAAX protease family)